MFLKHSLFVISSHDVCEWQRDFGAGIIALPNMLNIPWRTLWRRDFPAVLATPLTTANGSQNLTARLRSGKCNYTMQVEYRLLMSWHL